MQKITTIINRAFQTQNHTLNETHNGREKYFKKLLRDISRIRATIPGISE